VDARGLATAQGACYWPGNSAVVEELPVPSAATLVQPESGPPEVVRVGLPGWAADWDPGDGIVVPRAAVLPGEGEAWRRTDWFYAASWYLSGAAEQGAEDKGGPIHSYSFRLKGWPESVWERAWANRILLFLRRMAARGRQADEETLFGALPEARVVLTHDVDAVAGTWPMRIRLATARGVNSVRALRRGGLGRSLALGLGVAGALLRSGDMWRFEEIQRLEDEKGLRSVFHFYAGSGGSLAGRFINPSYDVAAPKLRTKLKELQAGGWEVGLHPGWNAWDSALPIRRERERLERALDAPVIACRQHWLKFSWRRTWPAQAEAGIQRDSTLGFNDRPGFRTGTALEYSPWDFRAKAPYAMRVLPMVFMDGHFHHYDDVSDEDRARRMAYWIDEIKAVRGRAAVLWHQRVLAPEYGWGKGFRELLEMV